MANLLSQQLKAIKAELTNLKTAHERGLGSLKVYSYPLNIDPSGHESGFWDLSITAEFDRTFSPYPFAYVLPVIKNGLYSLEMDYFTYSNDGFSVVLNALWRYNSESYNAHMVSSAPVTNISYTWSRS